eukprot:1605464-Rhodomonas_salina.1
MSSQAAGAAANQASSQLRRSVAKKFAGQRANAYIDLPDPIKIWKIVRGDKVRVTARAHAYCVFERAVELFWTAVQVISGSEKGKQATIVKVDRKKHRVYCEGLNL